VITAPEEVPTLGPGDYAGTFLVIFKQFRNTQKAITQSGSIRMSFSDSSYTYQAIATRSSDSTARDSLGDSGNYSVQAATISMDDIAWRQLGPLWYPSLYFKDTFTFRIVDDQIRISQENAFARWELNLVRQ